MVYDLSDGQKFTSMVKTYIGMIVQNQVYSYIFGGHANEYDLF
jgi:hypothetical protein